GAGAAGLDGVPAGEPPGLEGVAAGEPPGLDSLAAAGPAGWVPGAVGPLGPPREGVPGWAALGGPDGLTSPAGAVVPGGLLTVVAFPVELELGAEVVPGGVGGLTVAAGWGAGALKVPVDDVDFDVKGACG